jgi:regulator of protease activity HflC (stomatin/prohibitin superfamily)
VEAIKLAFQQLGKLFTWWVTINPWELGIRVRFGKHINVLQPGLHLKVPMVHRVYAQNTRLEVVDVPLQTLTTKDGKVLTISVVAGYRIFDIERLYLNIQRVDNTVLSVVMGAVAGCITASESDLCTADAVERAVQSKLETLQTDWGLKFSHVRVNSFAYTMTLRLIGGDHGRAMWSDIDLTRQCGGAA